MPLNPEFEPWIKDIIRYYEKADTELVFNEKSRHYVDYIREKKIFIEFEYPGQNSTSNKTDELMSFGLDGIRYARRIELKDKFGFSDYEIAVFEGTENIMMAKPYEVHLPKLLQKKVALERKVIIEKGYN